MKITITRLALVACGLLLAGCAALAPRPTAAPPAPPALGPIDATPALRALIEFDRQCRIVLGPRCHGGGAGPVVKIEGVGPGELDDALAGLALLNARLQCAKRCDEGRAAGTLRTDAERSQCLRTCQMAVVTP